MENTTQQEHKCDLYLSDLSNFYGTENYFNVMGFNTTDGINYIMKNGYSWFITDFLSLIKVNHKGLKNEEFLSIKLKIEKTKSHNKTLMEITDGNDKVLYTQNYIITDAKVNLNLYFVNNVLLLDSEY